LRCVYSYADFATSYRLRW